MSPLRTQALPLVRETKPRPASYYLLVIIRPSLSLSFPVSTWVVITPALSGPREAVAEHVQCGAGA